MMFPMVSTMNRRAFLATGAGAAALAGFANGAEAAEMTAQEKANVQVVNERIDRFSTGNLKAWRGVGVYFLKDGKIVEWYDYTISTERA